MAKRLFDIIGALILLVLLLPVILLFAIGVKISSPGPALFLQVRLGRYREPFTIWKLRSMYQGSEMVTMLQKGDPRITHFGRFLRSTYLDELPQLWNILRGEMSFVGPRPKLKDHLEFQNGGVLHQRYLVRPGLTGLTQLKGRRYTPNGRKAALLWDQIYVEKQSLSLDLWILWKTVPLVLRFGGV